MYEIQRLDSFPSIQVLACIKIYWQGEVLRQLNIVAFHLCKNVKKMSLRIFNTPFKMRQVFENLIIAKLKKKNVTFLSVIIEAFFF